MAASVWVRRSSENVMGTRWRVCIYHSAPSETVCPVISSRHKPWARWCPKMYTDKRRANKKQRRHGIFELCKFKLPFAVPVAVDRI